MIRLDTVNRSLAMYLGGAQATAPLQAVVSYSDQTATTYLGGTKLTNSNGTTAVTICSAPDVDVIRDIDMVTILNTDTVSQVVTVKILDTATSYLISTVTLLVGEKLTYTHGSAWQVVDNSGNVKYVVLSTSGVNSFSGGSTGLTPATATTGAVTLGGTLAVASGGTGTATPALVAGTNVTITGTWPNQTINSSAGSGTVTSVAATVPAFLSVAGSPITTSGTLAISYSGTALPIANGGTGQTTAPAAITALTGTQTSGYYLRSDGTNSSLAAIVAADVPTLNQNTTGTAANVTGTVAVANGGTSATTAGGARTSLGAAASGANTDITSVALTTGTISTAPSASTDIVNKSYADSIASGINFHAACNLATTAALPANTYNNGTGGVGATLTATANAALVVDSVTVISGQRILVKNEAAGANNGVYTVTQVGSGALPYILTRATDYDTSGIGTNEIDIGDLLLVISGTVNANTSWVQQTPLPITVGTTSIVFIQFAAVQTYTAGTGLTLATNQFSITNTGTAGTYGSASQVPVFVTNAQGQVTSVTNTAIAISGSAVTGNITGNAANVTGTVAIANGGSGQITAQLAMNAFAGSVTSGSYLRGNGTNVVMNTIQAADVPTLNQNTTGSAGSVANSLTSGTGISFSAGTTYNGSAAITINNSLPMVYPGAGIPNSTGTAWGTSYTTSGSGSVIALATSPVFVTPTLGTPVSGNFSTGTFTWPTFNQNTTGTAANVTGTVAIINGGTGQTTASAAFNALSPITTTGDLILGNGTNSATRLGIGTNGYVLTSNGTTATWAAATGGVSQIVAGTNVTISPTGGTGVVTINASGSGGASAYTRTSFTATAGQTVFTVTYAVGYLQVYVNGVLLATSDYTATSGTDFTLGVACASGDIVEALVITTSVTGITTGKSIAMAMIFGF
ncbi:hypothetical protein UFOVP162_31 [uncultured Caudovirales phage]|uniref:Uncharacterized protein n=1 Tax=uncultured Caudovirales phage TaxID=2100421 RepID=A0A6J7XP85_9CAUD|nr:hypothetical protein UFOVP162_31 [uncultured Caudovirales phage]